MRRKNLKNTKIKNTTIVLDALDHDSVNISKDKLKIFFHEFEETKTMLFDLKKSFGVVILSFIPLITTKAEGYESFLKIPGSVWYSVILISFIAAILNLFFVFIKIIILYFRGKCLNSGDFVDSYIFHKKNGNIFPFFNFRKSMTNKKKGGSEYGKESNEQASGKKGFKFIEKQGYH